MQRRDVLKWVGLTAASGLSQGALAGWTEEPAGTPGDAGAAPRVLCNQLGYLPSQAKILTVRGAAAEDGGFRLLTAAGKVAYQGSLTATRVDVLSGDRVQWADLSALNTSGRYVLTSGALRSDPLVVSTSVYAAALRTTMRGYHGQRCGCTVDLGGGYTHPPCHLDGDYSSTSGKTGKLRNQGGWHDAGDYGRYVVNSGITCGTLLWAWEMYPHSLRTLDLGIPKLHPKLPDYLEEVLWNLSWMLQMQDSDGGVFHKQTSDHFCAFIMPQDDHLVSEVIGTGSAPFKSTCATADFAAVMAIAARCYREYDAALAGRLQSAAERAWRWAIAHPEVIFVNPSGISTGDYSDSHCGDEIAWASAELFRSTGDAQYEEAFLRTLPEDHTSLSLSAPSWGDVYPLACWTYAMSPKGDAGVKAAIANATHNSAQALVTQAQNNGYGNTMSEADYIWGSNSVAGNQSLLLLVAGHLHADTSMANAALNNLHYLLGRNCWGVSWVTQVGTRPFLHPHHRPSAADGIAAPWPGLLSGGPNRHPGDAVAAKLRPAPPMRMWIDDQGAYSMNEIAINWNAPLVFLLAAANSME